MRLGSKWIAALAAGLVLLIGGIGVASAMGAGDRSAGVTTTAPALTDDRGTLSGQDGAGDRDDDRGTLSGRDGAGDRGTLSGRDGDENLAGSSAQRARAAALAAVTGASVREVERSSGTSGAVYHVELIQRDGTRLEVDLNANFETVKIEHSGDDD
ncbi:MAG TPA: PepSY domain-containing protein [Actinomycetes bacterium]|jgi:uncharacterized membrane protein YkoI|nr:PepSY domain-containing protein [Actinomycetes bacterium]